MPRFTLDAAELQSLQAYLRTLSAAAAPGVLIASSTSGLRPTALSESMPDPARFLVAHPFNPVYLLPLVEVCPGAQTGPAACERAVLPLR